LRFTWVLSFVDKDTWPKLFNDAQGLVLILSVLEIYRRAQWALIRLENENLSNFEKYRAVLEIPRLPKETHK